MGADEPEGEGEEGQSRPTLPRISMSCVPQTRCGVIFSGNGPLVLTLRVTCSLLGHLPTGKGHFTRTVTNG